MEVSDAGAVGEPTAEPVIEVGTDPQAPWVRVNGTDVSAAIRTAGQGAGVVSARG